MNLNSLIHMVNLEKLRHMLDSALEKETTESLNRWIQEQREEDKRVGISWDEETGGTSVPFPSSHISPCNKLIIESGVSEFVNYTEVELTDAFDSSFITPSYLIA